MEIKVVKFGGSSLADAAQFQKVAKIVKQDPARRYVVASAPGKRFAEDIKITDMLYECYDRAVRGEEIESLFSVIRDRYRQIIRALGIDLSLEEEFSVIETGFLCHVGRDFAASRGEYLSAKILSKYLGFHFIDAARVICFCEDGSFDAERTNEALSSILARHRYAVIPGFYGSMPNDTIKTFSRGGSDVTGSIVARAAKADLYENWTDVSGFLMADPRVVENPRVIRTITYQELRELSYMGATVLHEDAIFPVRFAGIPINVRNTNDPEAPGTMIVPGNGTVPFETKEIVTGIAGKKGFCVLSLEKDRMNQDVGFNRRVLEILEGRGISVEHVPSGIDTLSLIVDRKEMEGQQEHVVNSICHAVSPDSITIDDHLALIAIVGRGMVRAKGTAYRIFKAIAQADTNIRMIDQGSSELNIIIGVDEADYEKALRSIYLEFDTDNQLKDIVH